MLRSEYNGLITNIIKKESNANFMPLDLTNCKYKTTIP